MSVNVRYVFEKAGAIAPESILENELWMDIGNAVKDGVFDHHQGGYGYDCAFKCVMRETGNYKGILSYLEEERDDHEIVIHIHEMPDTDCIFCVYAVLRMIRENKENPAAAFDDKTAEKLIEYVGTIDRGKRKNYADNTMYTYICKIGEGIEDTLERSREIINEGLKLVDLVVKKLEAGAGDIDLFDTPLEEYVDIAGLKYSFSDSLGDYRYDKENRRVDIRPVKLWNTVSRSWQDVKSAVWEKMPSGEDLYTYAKSEDQCLLTVYPREIRDNSTSQGLSKVIISLNADLPEAEEYSLKPLAEVLEQCEQFEEELLFEKTGRYRRDHSQCRRDLSQLEVDGRFAEIPFYETCDPWFFTEKCDLIDVPRAGSIIPYDRILSIIGNASHLTRRASVLLYKGEGDQIGLEENYELGEISFGELYKKTRELIRKVEESPQPQHIFVYVKIGAAMLQYSNNWLRACCQNMVGKSDAPYSTDGLFQIDYRTCLYTDQTITILAATDGRNQSLGSLIREDNLAESQICKDLVNVLEHQLELRNMGAGLSRTIETINLDSDEIDNFNERLVKLNTRIEEDDLIANPLEQKVYAFMKNALDIMDLKNSVVTSAQLMIANAEQMRDRKDEKRESRIQAGIALVTVFTVFSAWTDAFDFFAKFDSGTDGGWWQLASNKPVFVTEVIFALIILVLGGIAIKYVFQAFFQSSDDSEKGKKN